MNVCTYNQLVPVSLHVCHGYTGQSISSLLQIQINEILLVDSDSE